PLVVSFGVIQGGINPNVIPESVQLRGTIRCPDKEQARAARQRLREIMDAIALACEVTASFSINFSVPPGCSKSQPNMTAMPLQPMITYL
ncbi:MAG: peptidase dimerization domain-containing protein, partial [Lentisphaeria bacterium]